MARKETMGNRLKKLRQSHGMTTEQVGNRLGYSVSSIQKHECDAVELRVETLIRYAMMYDVTTDYIAKGE